MFFRKQRRIKALEKYISQLHKNHEQQIKESSIQACIYYEILHTIPYVVGDSVRTLYSHGNGRIDRLNSEIYSTLRFIMKCAEESSKDYQDDLIANLHKQTSMYKEAIKKTGINIDMCCKPYDDLYILFTRNNIPKDETPTHIEGNAPEEDQGPHIEGTNT